MKKPLKPESRLSMN